VTNGLSKEAQMFDKFYVLWKTQLFKDKTAVSTFGATTLKI